MTREAFLTPTDRRLLRALAREPNLVHAARRLGIGRDRAVYRLRRLHRLYGRPIATGHPGGARRAGATVLTPLGRRLANGISPSPPPRPSQSWVGVYSVGAPPTVTLGAGAALVVAFRAVDRAKVRVAVDPETILVADRRFASSARNVLEVVVGRITRRPGGGRLLHARWAGRTIRAAVTEESVARLGIAPGRRVVLYLKAVSVRRLALA